MMCPLQNGRTNREHEYAGPDGRLLADPPRGRDRGNRLRCPAPRRHDDDAPGAVRGDFESLQADGDRRAMSGSVSSSSPSPGSPSCGSSASSANSSAPSRTASSRPCSWAAGCSSWALFTGAAISSSLVEMLDRPARARRVGLRPRHLPGYDLRLRHADGRGVHPLGQHGRRSARRRFLAGSPTRLPGRAGPAGGFREPAMDPADVPRLGVGAEHRHPADQTRGTNAGTLRRMPESRRRARFTSRRRPSGSPRSSPTTGWGSLSGKPTARPAPPRSPSRGRRWSPRRRCPSA